MNRLLFTICVCCSIYFRPYNVVYIEIKRKIEYDPIETHQFGLSIPEPIDTIIESNYCPGCPELIEIYPGVYELKN